MVEALTWWAQPRGGCRPAERKCWGSPGRMVTGSGGVVKGPHSGVWEASRVALGRRGHSWAQGHPGCPQSIPPTPPCTTHLWARLGVEPGDGAVGERGGVRGERRGWKWVESREQWGSQGAWLGSGHSDQGCAGEGLWAGGTATGTGIKGLGWINTKVRCAAKRDVV